MTPLRRRRRGSSRESSRSSTASSRSTAASPPAGAGGLGGLGRFKARILLGAAEFRRCRLHVRPLSFGTVAFPFGESPQVCPAWSRP